MQTRCFVKGEAQKSPRFWRFSAGFCFSQDRLFSRNSTRKPLNLVKSPIFTNAPCKTACLYNAPSMHTLELSKRVLLEPLSAQVVMLVTEFRRPLSHWGNPKQPMKLQQPRNYDFGMFQFNLLGSQGGNSREMTTSPPGHSGERQQLHSQQPPNYNNSEPTAVK